MYLLNLFHSLKRQVRSRSFYFSRRKPWRDISFIAIVSTGRTGTKFLAHFLNQDCPELLAMHEPFGKNTRKLSGCFIKNKVSLANAQKQLIRDRYEIQHVLFEENKNVFVESDGNLSLLIEPVKNVFPNHKILHIIRNPIDVVRSFCSRTRIVNEQKIQTYAYDEYWPVLPKDIKDLEIAKQWPDLSLIEKGAWIWKFRNQYVLDQINGNPNAITVKFEDIFDSKKSYQGLRKIIDFIKCKVSIDLSDEQLDALLQKKVNATDDFLIPAFDEWPDKEKAGFLKITESLARQFNY
jgi:sulfotransferase family protein